ncbi:MAG: heavy metal translocating P-type ATPase metal-binding domain-containing protein [Planctomycetota bacterium]
MKAPEGSEACRHCGLPVPASARFPGFCCPGCHQVYQLLHDSALGEFYELGGGRGRPLGVAPQPGRHAWLPELERASTVDGVARVRLDVQGIYCAACVWVLQELWRRRDGGVSIRIDPTLGRAELVYDPARLDLAAWLAEAERLGYRLGPATKSEDSPTRPLLLRFGICAALSLNAMMFAAAIYFGLAEGRLYDLFRTLSSVIATLAVLVGGPVFFRAAWAGVRSRVLHLDLPIAIGILLAWGGSLAGMLSTGEHSYFDTVTVFVTLMLGGRYVQEQALRRNRDYLLQNDGAEHLRATRLRGDEVETVPLRELARGDALLVAPGDLVPVRGVLLGEAEAFSLEWIRGESDPRRFAPGDEVPAGAVHAGERPSRIDAVEDLDSSGLLELLRGVEGGAKDVALPPFWARLNRVYVAGVLGLAALAAALWAVLDRPACCRSRSRCWS